MQAGPPHSRARREGRERQATPHLEVVGLILKGAYLRGLSWVPLEEIYRPAGQGLKSSYPVNPGINWVHWTYCPDSLNNLMLPQDCVLENGSGYGDSGQKAVSKDKGGRSLLLPRSGSWVNQRSCPLDDLL